MKKEFVKERLMNKDELIAFIKANGYVYANTLEKFPEVAAIPVVFSEWIDTGFENSTGKIYTCSACNGNYNPNKKDVALGRCIEKPDFCLHCAAIMNSEDAG